MKQNAKIISTYTGDTSGICSALYELGGMVVMHDPSGCNSTYSTHDEPRWYDMESLIFISGLTEKDAIFGNDEKLINDITDTVKELSPRFVAIAGTPIPYMTGFDYEAVAMETELRTGIPCFGFDTNGMHSYIRGASLAFAKYAERMCKETEKSKELSVNILGMTPLDFSVCGSSESVCKIFEENGISINSVWSMGSSFVNIENSARATVNVVISSAGIECAKVLNKKFGTPYVIGAPFGKEFTEKIFNEVKKSAVSGENRILFENHTSGDITIIGESVTSLSLGEAIKNNTGLTSKVICPLETSSEISPHCTRALYEDEIIPQLKNSRFIIADPMYKPICPESSVFIPLPHEAFSGRIYRAEIPNLIKDADSFIGRILKK